MISRTACVAFLAFAALLLVGLAPPSAIADDTLDTLRDGDIVVYRHALAPGSGDPPGFALDDCTTQRQLSEDGRIQAAEIGRALRAGSVGVSEVWSSQWCRTLETARLAFPDLTVQQRSEFSSFYQTPALKRPRTRMARELLDSWRGPGVLAVITHQVNITALTGIWPRSGEGVILRRLDDQLSISGRIAAP